MTFFMAFSIVCYLAILALLWCFRGFSRALKEGPPTVGLLVRVLEIDSDSPKENTSQVMKLPRPQAGPVRPVAAPRRASVSKHVVNLVGLAILLGSRGSPGTG